MKQGGLRQWMSDNENERAIPEKSEMKLVLQLSQLTALEEFLDHSIEKENPDGFQPTSQSWKSPRD